MEEQEKLESGEDVARKLKKQCLDCDQWFPVNRENFHRNPKSQDEFSNICKRCANGKRVKSFTNPEKAKTQSTEDLITLIDGGKFEVDQKWLLKELISQYKSPKCRDPLKALDMLMKVSGYNDTNTDSRTVMDSLIASLKEDNAGKKDDTGLSDT